MNLVSFSEVKRKVGVTTGDWRNGGDQRGGAKGNQARSRLIKVDFLKVEGVMNELGGNENLRMSGIPRNLNKAFLPWKFKAIKDKACLLEATL